MVWKQFFPASIFQDITGTQARLFFSQINAEKKSGINGTANILKEYKKISMTESQNIR